MFPQEPWGSSSRATQQPQALPGGGRRERAEPREWSPVQLLPTVQPGEPLPSLHHSRRVGRALLGLPGAPLVPPRLCAFSSRLTTCPQAQGPLLPALGSASVALSFTQLPWPSLGRICTILCHLPPLHVSHLKLLSVTLPFFQHPCWQSLSLLSPDP